MDGWMGCRGRNGREGGKGGICHMRWLIFLYTMTAYVTMNMPSTLPYLPRNSPPPPPRSLNITLMHDVSRTLPCLSGSSPSTMCCASLPRCPPPSLFCAESHLGVPQVLGDGGGTFCNRFQPRPTTPVALRPPAVSPSSHPSIHVCIRSPVVLSLLAVEDTCSGASRLSILFFFLGSSANK